MGIQSPIEIKAPGGSVRQTAQSCCMGCVVFYSIGKTLSRFSVKVSSYRIKNKVGKPTSTPLPPFFGGMGLHTLPPPQRVGKENLSYSINDSLEKRFYFTLFIKDTEINFPNILAKIGISQKMVKDILKIDFRVSRKTFLEKKRILCYDFNEKPSNGATLTLTRAMGVVCDTSKESMFEIEGMECYGGKKYVGSNCKKGKEQADGIFQLYKPS